MESGYREIIKRKLGDRCSKNPRYSLRALARDVNWDASQLSRVMNGKQQLSISSARLIAETLFEEGNEKELFLALVEFETAKKPEIRKLASLKIESLQSRDAVIPLQIEVFRVISEWYHIAILDYTLLDHADTRPEAVSKALGISELEAKLAIDRLLKLGLLEKKGNRLQKTKVLLAVPPGQKQQSVRTFHRQMIRKAVDAIEGQDVERRYLRAETLPMDSRNLG